MSKDKREKKEEVDALTKMVRDKAKVTLPSQESLAKLLKEIKDETEK